MAALMMSLTTQAKTQDVGGRVIDQNGEPLGFVSVALLTADSTYIQGATSDENGAFMIQTTDACCILRLSFIGYRTQYVDVKGSDVGIIQMEEDQPTLSEIIVKGQMPKTKLTGNSMVTTIQGTILSQSGTAKEMLAKVPGMTAKGDELEVLGSHLQDRRQGQPKPRLGGGLPQRLRLGALRVHGRLLSADDRH